ncbi:MAG: hypothetical protein GY725_16435 [bacterium]|nr:hypothetical protein [bacterium]
MPEVDHPLSTPTQVTGRRSIWLVAGLAPVLGLVLTVLAYEPALRAPFYMDDAPNIVHATGVHMTELSSESVWRALLEGHLKPRPVANLTFALDHLHSGLKARGYHRTNLIVHLGNGMALYWLIFTLLGRERDRVTRAAIAGSAVAVFLTHPLATQAVTYVVQRMASLATLLILLSLAAYANARPPEGRGHRAWFLLSFVFGLLAVGTKEIAVMLPPAILLYEACFHQKSWHESLAPLFERLRQPPVWIGLMLGTLILGILALPVLETAFERIQYYRIPDRDFGPFERILTETRVVFFYVSLFLWPAPSRLNLEHVFEPSRGLLDPVSTLLASAGWLVLLTLAMVLAWKRPRHGFAALGFFLFNIVESGPLPIELTFEHRFYPSMAFLVLLVAMVIAEAPPRIRWGGCFGLIALTFPLAFAANARNEVWVDPVAFYRDAAAKSPESYRAHYEYGANLGKQGMFAEALAPLERAIAIRNSDSRALGQAGAAALAIRDHARALDYLQRAVQADTTNAEALFNLGFLFDQLGHLDKAAPAYRRFIEVAGFEPTGHEFARQVAQVRARLALLETLDE